LGKATAMKRKLPHKALSYVPEYRDVDKSFDYDPASVTVVGGWLTPEQARLCRLAMVIRAAEPLSDSDRELLEDKLLGGKTWKEIAAEHGQTLISVFRQRTAIIRRLKQTVAKLT
jgi:hypothetical protein